MALGEVFVKMSGWKSPDRPARKPAHFPDGPQRYSLAPRPSSAMVHCRRHAPALDRTPHPAHVSRVIPIMSDAVSQLICPSIALVIISRRVIALTSRATLPCLLLHRTAVTCWASLSAYDAVIFCAYHTLVPFLDRMLSACYKFSTETF